MTADASTGHLARFVDLDAATLYRLLRLRVDVFVVEQECPYPELDGRDTEPDTWHVWRSVGTEPVAYLRVLDDGAAGMRIGRVVTAPGHRGTGLAALLMVQAVELVGGRPARLDAQTPVAGFYERFGFAVAGPDFVEDGIAHVPMLRPASVPTI